MVQARCGVLYPERLTAVLQRSVYAERCVGPSSSGKTIIIASTEGNVAVDGHEEAKVGLNVYRKK
jgi:hypothetical protein